MYLNHFGFKEKPFSITPDPDFLYFSDQHKAALAMLEYGVLEQSGITVVTGEVGCGKTTLIRHLLRRIPYDKLTVGLISNVHTSLGSLLHWVMLALKLYEGKEDVSRLRLFSELQEFLVREYAGGRRVVLIVDEAQNIGAAALEELRMLTNINADKDELLQIVLVGQPQLLKLLEQPELAQIAQRVTAEYHLEPLNITETLAYIRHRLQVAGGPPTVRFDIQAAHVIYYFSCGVPRLINTLCDHALVVAYANNRKTVDFETALDAVRQKRIGGVERFRKRTEEAENTKQVIQAATGIDIEVAVNG